jgi:transposase
VKEEVVYCGVDVAKAYLDAAIGKQKRRLANDGRGPRQLINWIKQIETKVQVICEPSGGYERILIQALVGARVKVSLVQANRVRQFARAAGILAKTDSTWRSSWLRANLLRNILSGARRFHFAFKERQASG